MNTAIRERTDQLHANALARYALALDERYQSATQGWSVSNTGKLRRMALALLGSPYHRVNERAWNDQVMDWLLQVVKASDAEKVTVGGDWQIIDGDGLIFSGQEEAIQSLWLKVIENKIDPGFEFSGGRLHLIQIHEEKAL